MRTTVSSLVLMMATSIIVVTSQDDGWTGCINQSLNKNQNLVRIQQPSRVCLSIANDTNWNSGSTSYIRASFEPKADEYSRFHIPNCTFWITHSTTLRELITLFCCSQNSNTYFFCPILYNSIPRFSTEKE